MPGRERALVIANRLPWPLDDGWKQRAFHVAQGVAARMETTLLTFDTNPAGRVEAAEALGGPVNIVTVPAPRAYTPAKLAAGILTRTPVHVWNQKSPDMQRALQGIVRELNPALCVFESSFVYPLAEELPASCTRVIDCHNIDTLTFSRYAKTLPPGPRRWYAARTARNLARFEASAMASADAVWVCSEADREMARGLHPGDNYAVVPNGVDTQHFQPLEDVSRDAKRLLFFGRLDYFPNVDAIAYFLREIWPSLRRLHPGVQFDIMGAGSVTGLPRDPGPDVRILGRVDDIRPVLARAGVVIVPLRLGGGTRLKILEALSMACPVVSTTVGAEGLDLRDGEEIVLADDAAAFAAAVSAAIAEPERAARHGALGRQTVTQRYQWSALVAEGLRAVLPGASGAK